MRGAKALSKRVQSGTGKVSAAWNFATGNKKMGLCALQTDAFLETACLDVQITSEAANFDL